MTLREVMQAMRYNDIVTVANWPSGEIYIDRETVATACWNREFEKLMKRDVMILSVGREAHDMIIEIRN